MKKLPVVLFLLIAVFVLNCKNNSPQQSKNKEQLKVETNVQTQETTKNNERKQAIDFTLTDLNGKQRTLSEQKGKVVLVDFWATWCPPCKVEIPYLKKLYAAYKDQGFSVWGVGLDKEEKLRQFVKEYDIEYPTLLGTRTVAQQYDVQGIPTSVLFDKNNRIAYHHVGFAPGMEKELEKEIKELLAE
ncbi:MAG: hypothetical protein B5M53_11730 [Candidatus Cloacimonas sp. 4484_209]|nr:MAG: hypothetical protein B5M53_11730 [Candidatus Cloacimonas sp. 4484_209]